MIRRLCIAVGLAGLSLLAYPQSQPFPTVRLRDLPEPLRDVYRRTKPEMTEPSRCAAAFDAGDPERQAIRCSVYVRLGAEGERRAMQYCEERRHELKIKSACAMVVE